MALIIVAIQIPGEQTVWNNGVKATNKQDDYKNTETILY